jgi:hypothetical protein
MVDRLPGHLRNADLAVERYGDVGRAWLDGSLQGDPLADAVVADLAPLGRRAGRELVGRAIAEGVDAVPEAPASVRALFAQLDTVPEWVDLDQLDRGASHLVRNGLQYGLVLAAAALMVGYTNPAAARPLVLTGRLVHDAGVRNLEVGDWLREVTTPGGLRRDGLGFERTVRVRLIHAHVRRHLTGHPGWDTDLLGVPISQPYLAHTLAEFGCIAIDGMRVLGATYTRDELDDVYALWRYVGHLAGVTPALQPATEADQHAIRALYQLTRPPVDEDSKALVAGLLGDYLVAEVEDLLPARLPRRRQVATSYVHGLVRAVIGDALADELEVPPSRFARVVPVLGRVTRAGHAAVEAVPGGKALRVRRGERYRTAQEAKMRAKHGAAHDLVDSAAAPRAGDHPAASSAAPLRRGD